MAILKKENNNFDLVMVRIKFLLKGNRNMTVVSCTASQCMEFTDYMNGNRAVAKNKHEREQFENKFYIFDDIMEKKQVVVSLNDVKYWEIPYFIDNGEHYDIKILTIN